MMVSQKISFAVYVVFHESNKKNCMTQSQYCTGAKLSPIGPSCLFSCLMVRVVLSPFINYNNTKIGKSFCLKQVLSNHLSFHYHWWTQMINMAHNVRFHPRLLLYHLFVGYLQWNVLMAVQTEYTLVFCSSQTYRHYLFVSVQCYFYQQMKMHFWSIALGH